MSDKATEWTGVRNFQARNNLKSMAQGDATLFYHSVTEKQIVGIAEVIQTAHLDPTAKEGEWFCVTLRAVETLQRPVTLELIKKDPFLKEMALLKQSRLSVLPVREEEFKHILQLGKTKL